MPVLSKKIKKRYYTIGEVAEMFDVSKSLIRYWEKEFDNLRPTKNSKGDRKFTEKNIVQLQLIYHLVKERQYTLKGAKQEIKENREKHIMKNQVLSKLKKLRSDMVVFYDEM